MRKIVKRLLKILQIISVVLFSTKGIAQVNIPFDVKCDNSGSSDVTQCLQKVIDNEGILKLGQGRYLITKSLKLKSNLKIFGESAVIVPQFESPRLAVFMGDDVTNVNIDKISILGSGYFSESSIRNPYKIGSSESLVIGYSNLDIGFYISGNSSGISISNCTISGVDFAIWFNGDDIESKTSIFNVEIVGNTLQNLGEVGVRLTSVSNASLRNNIISNIQGNQVFGNKQNISAAKFADGIYATGLKNSMISDNYITNIKRIGIVLEGVLSKNNKVKQVNDNIIISNNHINNLNNSRGTEYNAGIWVEPYVNNTDTNYYKTKHVTIVSNVIDNWGSKRGAHAQWGIRLGALDNVVEYNIIKNFSNIDSAAIVYSYGYNLVENNHLFNNTKNIFAKSDNTWHSQLKFMN